MAGHVAVPGRPAVPAPAVRDGGPGTVRQLAEQVHYVNRSFWRTPVAAFFTLVFPLTFLVLICAIVGNETVDAHGGVRLAQFVTPAFAVFGVAMASFPSLAISVATAREAGVLKRLRGTPVPMWVQLAGRVGSAVWISLLAVVVLVGVGAVAYHVQVPWDALPALLLTLLVGIATFAALGLAVVSLVPSATAVQAATTGVLVPLSFISDIFNFGSMPLWLDRLGWFFPLRHFAVAVADLFDPYAAGTAPDWQHLGVMVLWGTGAAAVAVRRFSTAPADAAARRPHRAWHLRHRPAVAVDVPEVRPSGLLSDLGPSARRVRQRTMHVEAPGRPGVVRLLLAEAGHVVRALVRDRSAFFFSMVFPLLLLVLFHVAYRGATYRGAPLDQWIAAAFTAYGIAITAYVSVPGLLVEARENGAFKRLQGTPLPVFVYLAGTVLAACAIAATTAIVMYGVGTAFLDVTFSWSGVLPTVAALALGTACWTALGMALSMVARSGRTVSAVSLGTLLPLCFVSDVFVMGTDLPGFLSAVGWTFPLRHFAHAAFDAMRPAGIDWGTWWGHLGVMALWAVGAALLAWWLSGRESSRSAH